MTTKNTVSTDYSAAGVDTDKESVGLQRLTSRIQSTWLDKHAIGGVQLKIGHFANIIKIGENQGLAITTDGVGTKVLIAQLMGQYDTIGIDCVAMNVNDLLCVGARPLSMVDYIAIENASPDVLDQIAIGLAKGAELSNISICGGEIAQLGELLSGAVENGEHVGIAFDLAGTAVGMVQLDRIIKGDKVKDRDVLIGLESNGIHSNGLTLARRILFEQNQYSLNTTLADLHCTLGEELLKPTHIYVREIMDILDRNISVHGLVHITSDGFLNLTRIVKNKGYVIDNLPPVPTIFKILQANGHISDAEMFRVFNMGIGFCIVVSPDDADEVLSVLAARQRNAYRIGYVRNDAEKSVLISQFNLIGKDKRFQQLES